MTRIKKSQTGPSELKRTFPHVSSLNPVYLKKLLTVNPQSVNDNYVRTSFISRDYVSGDLNFDYRTRIALVDVQLDAAIDTAMIPLEIEVLRAIDESRLLPLGSDRTYHFIELVFAKNSSTFSTEQEQRNYTVKLTSVSKPITV